MRKPSILALVLLALAGVSQVGCRMCQNGFDYASPVAGAACGGCQGCRAGSCVSTSGPVYSGTPVETVITSPTMD